VPQPGTPKLPHEQHETLIRLVWTEALDHLDKRHKKALYRALTRELNRILDPKDALQGDLEGQLQGSNCVYVGVEFQPCTLPGGRPGTKRCEKYLCDEGYEYVCGPCQPSQ
jgi:hypothetical protein